MKRRMVWVIVLAAALVLPACGGKEEPAAPPAAEPGRPTPEAERPMPPPPAPEPAPPPEAPPAEPAAMVLPAERDARVFGHSSERNYSGGASTRLRARSLSSDAPELILVDFAAQAIRDFLAERPGKEASATLVLAVRQVQNGPGKLQVAALVAANDWGEGTKSQEPAETGNATFTAARFAPEEGERAPWAAPDGTAAANLKDLVWDAAAAKPRGLVNSTGASLEDVANVTQADQAPLVRIPLDQALLKDLLENEMNRGLVLFTTDGAILDFFSREQSQAHCHPRLEVAVK